MADEHLELTAALELSKALASEPSLERVVERLLAFALEHAGAARALLLLPSPGGLQLEAQAGPGASGVRLLRRPVSATDLPESVHQEVLRTRQRVLVEDAALPRSFAADDAARTPHTPSWLGLPLLQQARLIGVLCLERPASSGFSARRSLTLELLAFQAASALENARLLSKLGRAERSLAEVTERRLADEAEELHRAYERLEKARFERLEAEPPPRSPPAARLPRRGAGDRAVQGRGLRVLVAEDNEFNAQLVSLLLRRRGHVPSVVRRGEAALELAKTREFDLLLLDLHMPGLDGFGVIEQLRAFEGSSGGHLPVIALTARSRQVDRARCLALGMDAFLSKPIHAEALWKIIDELTVGVEGGAAALDAEALLAACGGEDAVLDCVVTSLSTHVPPELARALGSLKAGEAAALRETAHKLGGMLATVSSEAGLLAAELEDLAEVGALAQAEPVLAQIQALTDSLLLELPGLSVAQLRERLSRPSSRLLNV
jgi:CheY-like chemotaxis protein